MRKRTQSGFTLLEVMFASTTGLFIMLPAMDVLFRAMSWYTEVQSMLTLNREAREAMDLIGNGGRRTGNGNDGTPYLYGFHGRKAAPTAASIRLSYKLRYQSNNLTLEGDSMASLSITCTAAATPLPDCASAGQVKTVSGWFGNDVALTTANRSVNSRTVEVVMTLTDPYEAQRLKKPADASATYRTVLTLNRDESDP